jgi:hypothetical protein
MNTIERILNWLIVGLIVTATVVTVYHAYTIGAWIF